MAQQYDNITETDNKSLNSLDKLLKSLVSMEVHIGYQRDDKQGVSGAGETGEGADAEEEDLPDVIDVAMWNELGTSRSPSRPFMRQTIETQGDRIQTYCQTKLNSLVAKAQQGREVEEGDVVQAFDAMGEYVNKAIRRQIRDGDFEPNAPSTIARKSKGKAGDVKPLIDTGRMRQSIHHQVVRKNGSGSATNGNQEGTEV